MRRPPAADVAVTSSITAATPCWREALDHVRVTRSIVVVARQVGIDKGRKARPARGRLVQHPRPGIAGSRCGTQPHHPAHLRMDIRRGEEAEEARRVRSVALDQRIGIDDVALRLAHLGAVLDDHALGQQAAERLAEAEEAEIAEHLGEEPRVQQVEHGVLDAADVLVHASWPSQ